MAWQRLLKMTMMNENHWWMKKPSFRMAWNRGWYVDVYMISGNLMMLMTIWGHTSYYDLNADVLSNKLFDLLAATSDPPNHYIIAFPGYICSHSSWMAWVFRVCDAVYLATKNVLNSACRNCILTTSFKITYPFRYCIFLTTLHVTRVLFWRLLLFFFVKITLLNLREKYLYIFHLSRLRLNKQQNSS